MAVTLTVMAISSWLNEFALVYSSYAKSLVLIFDKKFFSVSRMYSKEDVDAMLKDMKKNTDFEQRENDAQFVESQTANFFLIAQSDQLKEKKIPVSQCIGYADLSKAGFVFQKDGVAGLTAYGSERLKDSEKLKVNSEIFYKFKEMDTQVINVKQNDQFVQFTVKIFLDANTRLVFQVDFENKRYRAAIDGREYSKTWFPLEITAHPPL